MEYRIETDTLGEFKVPKNVYYGIQTARAKENFKISGKKVEPEFIKSIAEVKKACAMTNCEVGLLSSEKASAIIRACDEIIEGKFHDQFVVDPIQGGAGTSHNMNANEVIANRAVEILGGELGDYSVVHPLDDVNEGQSTNDIYPTAGKIAVIRLLFRCRRNLEKLVESFGEKAQEFDDVIKMGRTQLQDAIPIRLGQEFAAYKAVISRDLLRFDIAIKQMSIMNIGGTAIGTGLNADVEYLYKVGPNIMKVTGLDIIQTTNLIDGTQNLDRFSFVSGIVKTCAINLSKIANDLRLMSSGPTCGLGEIELPAKQAGSTIMPGKVNPVIPEVVNQVAFNIIGNDMTVTMAIEAGQLELNAFEPIIFYNLFESIRTLKGAVDTFTKNCIDGIVAKRNNTGNMVDNSIGIITALSPHIGYVKAAEIAEESLKTGVTIKKLIVDKGIMNEEELNEVLNIYTMTNPGISGKRLLIKHHKLKK